jgi:hypothetical protein
MFPFLGEQPAQPHGAGNRVPHAALASSSEDAFDAAVSALAMDVARAELLDLRSIEVPGRAAGTYSYAANGGFQESTKSR